MILFLRSSLKKSATAISVEFTCEGNIYVCIYIGVEAHGCHSYYGIAGNFRGEISSWFLIIKFIRRKKFWFTAR